jgi:hypothetical protein
MPVTFTKIQVTTLGSAQANIDFQSIPATYTDLVLKLCVRGGTGSNWVNIGINGGSVEETNLKHILNFGGTIISQAYNYFRNPNVAGNASVSNLFSNGEIYLTNYAGSNNKTMIGDGVQPSNAAGEIEIQLAGFRWPFTSAINRLTLSPDGGGNFDANSSASLYGIKKD